MGTESQHVVSAIQKAKQILFVIHEYLPLPLAFWFPTIVSILKDQGKEITILIAEESRGWLQQVDRVYPNDMVLQLEQLRQEISFPLVGDSVGDVSYEIENGKLKVTIVPTGEPVDTKNMSSSLQGNSFDCVVGVGISATHPLLEKVSQASSSLTHAEYIFIGTFSVQSSFGSKLPSPKQITVIEPTADVWLRQVVTKLADISTTSDASRELITLFMHAHSKATHKTQYLDKESHEFLGKLLSKSVDTAHMAKVFDYDAAKTSQTLEALLVSRQFSESNDTVVFGLPMNTRNEQGISVIDVCHALYYLPKYDSLKQVVVVVSETENMHHVTVSGSSIATRQIATKYGFPMTDHVTGGLVSGISFDKLCQDISRVISKEELVPQSPEVRSNRSPLGPISSEVESDIEVSPTIPATPISQETLAKIEQLEEEESLENTSDESLQAMVDTTPQIKTSSGIDFAAIAKKMRESSN